MSLFKAPYKYIMDTSSMLSQKEKEDYPRKAFESMWKAIDDYIKKQIIVICSEIQEEIKDIEIVSLLKNLKCGVLSIDYDVQENVRKIVRDNPEIINFNGKKGSSSGDVFLIATAMNYNLTVITQENKESPKKIPKICEKYGIKCLDLKDFLIAEKLKF